jgi:lipoprotein-releasing system ATP-binding protein
MSEIVLSTHGLQRRYEQSGSPITVLQGVDLEVRARETVAIVGASGSGKSSLLHLLAGLDTPTQGEVRWGDDTPISRWSPGELGRHRNRHLGFVFQFHHLLPEFDALDNVAMPLWIRRMPQPEASRLAAQALAMVGLQARARHRPSELSGGERQRVALARAMVTRPRCLLADEPTGNLDRETAMRMFDLLQDLCRQEGTALVLVTHDETLARRCDRMLRLHQGLLVSA